MEKQTNPYILSFFTVFLAGVFSIFGSFFIEKYQIDNGVKAKEKEYKVQSYKYFLEKVNRRNSPIISKFLHLGSLAEEVATDSEIQILEDNIEQIVKTTDLQEIYWKLNSEFNILRIFGDTETNQICSDILDLIYWNYYRVDWEKYPSEAERMFEGVARHQREGVVIGWEEKVLPDDRISIIMISRLFEELINHLRQTVIEP